LTAPNLDALVEALNNGLFKPDGDFYIMCLSGDGARDRAVRAAEKLPESSVALAVLDGCDFPPGEKIPGRPALFLARPDHAAETVWLLAGSLKLTRVRFSADDAFRLSCPGAAETIEETAGEAIQNIKLETVSRLIKLRLSLRNMPPLLRCGAFPALETPCPALVCGAGPSLESQIPIIAENRGKFILIAAGRVGSRLISSGIIPDFIVQVDADSDFDSSGPAPERTTLVAPACSSNLAPAKFRRTVWSAGSSIAFKGLLKNAGIERRTLAFSKTATVTALDFAFELGCRPVALLGSDLCLSAAGEAHLSGYSDGGMRFGRRLKIPGVSGGGVVSTPEFVQLKKALERYIQDKTAGKDAPPLFNCTPGGAAVRGAQPMDFEEFLKQHPGPAAKIIFPGDEKPPFFDFEKMDNDLAEAAALSGRALVFAARILKGNYLSADDIPRQRSEFFDAMNFIEAEQTKFQGGSPLKPVFDTLDEQISEFLAETPDSNGDNVMRRAGLCLMRQTLKQDICRDIKEDFILAAERMASGEPGSVAGELIFPSFRKFAVSFVSKSNQRLADMLEDRAFAPSPPGYEIHTIHNWQLPPHVRMTGSEEKDWPLCGDYLTMERSAEEDVRAFIKDSGFDPSRHLAVVFGAGNWLHPCAFPKAAPGVRMVIFEPWPELLSHIIDRAMFPHKLPPETVIAAKFPCSGEWREELLSAVRAAAGPRGLEPRVFVSKYLGAMPEISRMLADFKTALFA
jgi:hypothetical protein